MPPVIARRRSLRAFVLATAGVILAGSLGYVVHIWPAPAPFVVPPDRPPPATLLPITGDVHDAAPVCFAFLDEWMGHPGWQVTIERGYSEGPDETHMMRTIQDRVTIDADGDGTWTTELGTRIVHVPPFELARLRAAAFLSCVKLPLPELDWGAEWVVVRWGTPKSPGVAAVTSLATAQVDVFLDAMIERYVRDRLDERRGVRRSVTIPPPQAMRGLIHDTLVAISVDADGEGRALVRSAHRTLALADLAGEDLVDAIEWIELGGDPNTAPSWVQRAIRRVTRLERSLD